MTDPDTHIALVGTVLGTRPLAIKVLFGAVEVWLPRAEIAIDPPNGLGRVHVTMPRWRADEKGLVAEAAEGQGVLL